MIDNHKKWWKSSVVYQIYPASFKDGNGDGIGDIPGIISKLDYIANLGVNIIWLCPMYDSPQVDMGYDISNYEDVYPPYGTLADMELLIQESHARGMRVMLDLVINHTSDQHPWFIDSRSSKDNPKRDWYIWRKARYGSDGQRNPPNNWRANFGGGSAWEWDPTTEEYYLHLFTKEQPDLNWENPEARRAIYASSLSFWLERGVDGFRVDTVNMYSKPPGLPDAPISDPEAEAQAAFTLYCNGPRIHEYLGEMNDILREYNAITVGELPHTPERERVLNYVSAEARQLDMVFQFDVADVGLRKIHNFDTIPRDWTLPDFKKAVARTQDLIRGTDAWTTVFLENHDLSRSISRFASDLPHHRVASGKMLALLETTLSGTLFLYQGQEIGAINAPAEGYPVAEYKDVESILYYKMVNERSGGCLENLDRAFSALQHLARDHSRIPMAWDGALPNAGFSAAGDRENDASTGAGRAKPWMATHPLASEINVADQIKDEGSVLSFWRRMLRFRREHEELLVYGNFRLLQVEDPDLFMFTKDDHQGDIVVVVLNFTKSTKRWKQPCSEELGLVVAQTIQLRMLMSSVDGMDGGNQLAPFEARIYHVDTLES
ncbi:hypothetical protein VTL71DRAFT_6284 [Oculimacula yallundae]|uniref:Glycosyl hydrolase family 13 catalytic domain-containing protein n=1 Tax=Oculimacula yallundae TaxID=86028 RepID=A0ABR4BZ68_9HELO